MSIIRKNDEFNNTARKNTESYLRYYERLKELALSSFVYENLPDTVDDDYLEQALFHNGKAVFFKDDVTGFAALKCLTGSKFDIYGNPVKRTATAANGMQIPLTAENSVIIYNNIIRQPSESDARAMAARLCDYDQTIDVNVRAQKTPILILCDEDQRLTMKNLYMRYDGNQPFIFGTKGLDPNSIKALSTGAPYIADRIYDLKMQYWNEALTYLGIPNMSVEKKERMLTDEVERSAGGTIASRFSRLKARQKAVEKINKMFGLNIAVHFRDIDDTSRPETDEGREE